VIQFALLTDVHAQLEPVVTAMLALRPVDGAEALVGDTLYVQLLAVCVMTTDWPATVSVPFRANENGFGATV
jgi:hypothetical protein